MISHLLRYISRAKHLRRLEEHVERNRQSFEIRDFAKRREAAKAGWQRRRADA